MSGTWSGNFVDGLLGTLISPNRGLLVFSPWIAVALLTLVVPAVRRRLSAHSLICVLIVSLIPYLIILSKYSVWWGGHCFGPRYWTDVIPLFAILFAYGLDWMLARSRVLGGDLGHGRHLFDRRPVDRSFLLSEQLELPAA